MSNRSVSRLKTAYILAAVLYCAFCLGLVGRYATLRDGYHLGLSLGALLIPPALSLLYRLLRLRPVYRLNLWVLGFTFIGYPLGGCLDLYRTLTGFDKVAHALSGVLVSLICLLVYCALKPGGHWPGPHDVPLAVAFSFFGSMAVAGLWEIGEYLLAGPTGLDLQRTQTSGVADSMQDMLVCLLGTLFSLPQVARACRDKGGLFSACVRDFLEIGLNLKKPEPPQG